MEPTEREWLDPSDPNAVHLKYVDDQYAVCWHPDTAGSKMTTDLTETNCVACANKLSEIVDPTWSTTPMTKNEETDA